MTEAIDRVTAVVRRNRRIAASYAVLAVVLVAALAVSLTVGSSKDAKPALGGAYTSVTGRCVGTTFEVLQSGSFATLSGANGVHGDLRVTEAGLLHGDVRCRSGVQLPLDLVVRSGAARPDGTTTAMLTGTVGREPFLARGTLSSAATASAMKPARPRPSEETFGRFLLAIAAVILAARLVGIGLRRLGQPQVMGEVLAGILLGPSLVGAIAPGVESWLFPPDIVTLLGAGAFIGLAFYLFLVGMEFDPSLLRGRVVLAALVSNASVVIPMSLGLFAAIPLYPLLAPHVHYLPFALFSGLALSITAFPVLARILVERRMLRAPVGSLALAAASADDITAWLLIAVASAAAHGKGSAGTVIEVLGLTVLFVVVMWTVVRRLLARISSAYDEAGHVPAAWLTAIFVGVLLSSYTASRIGVATIFGAFVFGVVMPRRADLSAEVSERLESFVVTVLLPLFFVVTGLKVDVRSVGSLELWAVAGGILAIAVLGKWGAATAAGHIGGMQRREAIALGALMNTRGLTELVVLNIGLGLGVISPTLFTILVLMALLTTFATGPALRLIDPRNTLAEPPADALHDDVRPEREHAILVAAPDERNLGALASIGAALARSIPPRELVLARLLEPVAFAAGTSSEQRDLERSTAQLVQRRRELESQGVRTRVAAFSSPSPGHDVVRLASDEHVDVVLVDGRRPLLGEGIPQGDVGEILATAPSDAAVLVSRGRALTIDADHPVMVPFGGADHDWAALELAAWLAAAHGASLQLIGIGASEQDGRDASGLLAEASLIVQQMAGVAASPLLVDANARALIAATSGAGIVLLGLSARWREEGVGTRRALLVRRIDAPVLFVRRGVRPGALAGSSGADGFTWSHIGMTGVGAEHSGTLDTLGATVRSADGPAEALE